MGFSYLKINPLDLLLIACKYKPDILIFLLAPELYVFNILHKVTDFTDQGVEVTFNYAPVDDQAQFVAGFLVRL